jgi:hypothetical protein
MPDAIRARADIDVIRKDGVELVRADCLGPTTPRLVAIATRPSWASLVEREQMPASVETLDGVLAVVAEALVTSEHEIAYGG